MYGYQLRYNLLVALIIMLLLLMMQLEKLGFIALDRNLMCLILLRSGKLWMPPYAFDLLMYSIYSATYDITGLAIVH